MSRLMEALAQASTKVVEVDVHGEATFWRVRAVTSEDALRAGARRQLLHAGLGETPDDSIKLTAEDFVLMALERDAIVAAAVVASGLSEDSLEPCHLTTGEPGDGQYRVSSLPDAVRNACWLAVNELTNGKEAAAALRRFRGPVAGGQDDAPPRRKAGKNIRKAAK
jgi:hypothetical protein